MNDANDAGTRDHDRVKLSIFLQGRETVTVGKYEFPAREAAIISKAIDVFVRKILEGDRPEGDE